MVVSKQKAEESQTEQASSLRSAILPTHPNVEDQKAPEKTKVCSSRRPPAVIDHRADSFSLRQVLTPSSSSALGPQRHVKNENSHISTLHFIFNYNLGKSVNFAADWSAAKAPVCCHLTFRLLNTWVLHRLALYAAASIRALIKI